MATPTKPEESLGSKQKRFVKASAEWLTWGYARGYAFSYGEALRTKEQAALNKKNGTGIACSLHLIKLALDVNLFLRNGKGQWEYITDSKHPDWIALGEKWESMGEGHCWGGRFGDGNHISISHGGIK